MMIRTQGRAFAFAMCTAVVGLGSCGPDPAAPPPASDDQAKALAPGAPAPRSSASIPSPAPSATEADPFLAVEAEGLRWFLRPSGSARPLPFGQPQEQVLASLERVRGPAGQGINEDCGAGPVEYAVWPDGLSLVFQNDLFVGWGLDGRAAGAISTAAGIGPGSTRSKLESAYRATITKTSLGTEFNAGGIYGVLDGASATGRITDMWAGVSCVAR